MAPDENVPVPSEEPDEPIPLLRALELEPETDLPMRVRRGIERRLLARELLGFSWSTIAGFAMEWLSLLLSGFGSRRPPKGERRS